MKKLILAAAMLCLPVAIALAQPAAAPAQKGAAPAAAEPKAYSLYGVGGSAAPTTLEQPKLNLLPTLEYMRQVINPHANAYWAAEGSLNDDDTSKVDGAPTDDDSWNDQVSRAATLMEAGNGLFTAGRPRNGACTDNPAAGRANPAGGSPAATAGRGPAPARGPAPTCDMIWNHYAQQLIDGGAAGMAASRAHNAKAAFDAGSQIYDACFSCHNRFIPRPVNSRYTAPFPSDDEIRQKGGAKGQ